MLCIRFLIGITRILQTPIRFISNRIRIFIFSIRFIRKGTICFLINSDSVKLFGFGTSLVSPKMMNLVLPMTPLFHCTILFYSKKGDVCKRTQLKRLSINWDMRVLSLKKTFSKFWFITSKEKLHKSAGFQYFSGGF